MEKITKKRRTVDSIVRKIRKRLTEAQDRLDADETEAALSGAKAALSRRLVADLQALLEDVEEPPQPLKKGGPENAK